MTPPTRRAAALAPPFRAFVALVLLLVALEALRLPHSLIAASVARICLVSLLVCVSMPLAKRDIVAAPALPRRIRRTPRQRRRTLVSSPPAPRHGRPTAVAVRGRRVAVAEAARGGVGGERAPCRQRAKREAAEEERLERAALRRRRGRPRVQRPRACGGWSSCDNGCDDGFGRGVFRATAERSWKRENERKRMELELSNQTNQTLSSMH